MNRPVTDQALLDDILAPRARKIPIPNPALARFLDEIDQRRADLKASTQRFTETNDRLERNLRGR